MMRARSLWIVAAACLAAGVVKTANGALRAQTESPAARTGTVASTEEGSMEGVLVSAKQSGSTVTITVVSDAQGRYRFPSNKLPPGQYAVGIRAVGYDLD